MADREPVKGYFAGSVPSWIFQWIWSRLKNETHHLKGNPLHLI